MACLVAGFLAATALGQDGRKESPVVTDYSEDWRTITLSQSPDGLYSLVVKSVPDLPKSRELDPNIPRPGEATALFLVRNKPYKEIAQIDSSENTAMHAPFRSYRLRGAQDFSSFWSSDGNKFAVLFSYRRDSGLAVFEKTGSAWRKLSLPKLNWVDSFNSMAKAQKIEAPTMRSEITDVEFEDSRIVVELSGNIDGEPNADVSITYSYRRRGRRWVVSVDSSKLVKSK
jgi:hypothetical protein